MILRELSSLATNLLTVTAGLMVLFSALIGTVVAGSASSAPSSLPTTTSASPAEIDSTCGFGDVRFFNARSGDMIFNNGTHTVVPTQCLPNAPLELAAPMGSSGSSAPVPPFPTSGWVEDAGYANCTWWGSCASFSAMSGTWTVPALPTINNWQEGQIIYLFIGMQDQGNDLIVQPVLAYGPVSGCYENVGGNWWGYASFFVYWNGFGSTCVRSTYYGAGVGDTISGTIQESSNCGSGCLQSVITTRDTNLPPDYTSTLTVQSWKGDMKVAYVTLEAYYVKQCGDYPASGSTLFSNLNLAGGSPGWNPEVRINDGCGESVQIVSNSQVRLWY